MQYLGRSRQAWYQDNARRRKRQEHHAQVLDFVARIRCRQPRIGARKLHYLLNTQADKRLNIGRDRLTYRSHTSHRWHHPDCR